MEFARSQEGVLARFWEIYILFNLTRFEEASGILEEYEHLFGDEWQAHLFFLKRVFLNEEGLEVEKTAIKYDQKFILACFYFFKLAIIYPANRELGLEYMQKSHDLSEEIDYYGMIVWIYSVKANHIHQIEGRKEEALELLIKAEKIALDHHQDFFHLHILIGYGQYYLNLEEYDKAMTYLERVYTQAHEKGYAPQIANSAHGMMIIYNWKGKLDKALKFALEIYELEKNSQLKARQASFLNSISSIYTKLGDLDKAMEFLEKTLQVFEELDWKQSLASALSNIGNIYKMRDNYDEALNHFERAYELWSEVNHPMGAHFGLPYLVTLLSTKDRERAKVYLDKFELIEEENRGKSNVTFAFNMTKAIYLKSSSRLRAKMQSQELFEKLFEENKALGFNNTYILPHLIELLLLEYGTSKDEEVLDELRQHLDSYQLDAEKYNIYPAMIKAYQIKSQLLMVEGKFEESESVLDQAVGYAMEKNLHTLLNELKETRADLAAEVERMEILIQSNSDLATRMKKSRVLEYIKKAQEKVVSSAE